MVKYSSFLILTCWLIVSCSTQQTAVQSVPSENTAKEIPKKDSVLVSSAIKLKKVWDADAISNFISSQNGRITGCYESLKLKKSSASGTMVVRFKVYPSGTVDSFSVVEDKINDENLKRCVRSVITSWKFEAVDSTNHAIWLEVPYDFTDFYTSNQLLRSEDETTEIVNRSKNQLSACLLDFDGSVEMTIDISIAPNGKVNKVSISESTIEGSDAEDCIKKNIYRWLFKPVESDQLQTIKFSYVYSK